MDFEFGGSGDLGCGLFVVAGHAVGVDPVLVGVHGEVAGGQKAQIDFDVASGPIGHGADVPVLSVATRNHYILGNFSVEGNRFVPDGRNGSQIFEGFGFALVVGRAIGEHLQRAFVNNVHG